MIFEQHRTGGDRNFSYLLADERTREAMIVDPSYEPAVLLTRARELGVQVRRIVITHRHPDHVAGVDEVRRATQARVYAWREGGGGHDEPLDDGDEITLGAARLRAIHTPGHADDHICLHGAGKLLSGDILFVGKVGGTDLGAGARREYDSLHRTILVLPDQTEVWPGHDFGVRPSSTIGEEKRTNPFLLCRSFEEFVGLKRNWTAYKKEHGIA